jgi:hypothetical protein
MHYVVYTSFSGRARGCTVYFVSTAVDISDERGSVCLTVWVRWARRCVWVEWLPKNEGLSVWECVVVICVNLLIFDRVVSTMC